MAKLKKIKKNTSGKKLKIKNVKKGKKGKKMKLKSRKAEQLAKKAARKGDGSFPDTMFIVKDKNGLFYGFDTANLAGVDDNAKGAIYKMRRVADVVVQRKIAR